jgi:hypothetical protein
MDIITSILLGIFGGMAREAGASIASRVKGWRRLRLGAKSARTYDALTSPNDSKHS